MRLINGEALEEMDKLIKEGIKVDAIICDPPYGVTSCEWDEVIPFTDMWNKLNRLIKSNGAILLFGSEPFSSNLRLSNKNYKYDWIWIKNKKTGFANAKRMPLRCSETISVFYSKSPTYNPQNLVRINKVMVNGKNNGGEGLISKKDRGKGKLRTEGSTYTQEYSNYPNQILNFSSVFSTVHPTQKPIELMEYLIKTYTNENETVLDFTMGSGSTGVACKHLNRHFIGIELDLDYYNIALERINATENKIINEKKIEDILDEF